jgi:hypothetical protein
VAQANPTYSDHFLKDLLSQSLGAMEGLTESRPIDEEGFVFGTWEYFALGLTATLSEATKVLEHESMNRIVDDLTAKSTDLLASTIDVQPDQQAMLKSKVRSLLAERVREYSQANPFSRGRGTVSLFAKNMAVTCQLKPSDRFVVSLTVPVFLDSLAIAPFLTDVAGKD